MASALPILKPGYMDAYYYYHVAENIYKGRGFVEDFIWNYLDDPRGIPHPSHLYWMPLPSILVYISFLIFGPSYRSSQLPFILLSSFLPLVTYYISYETSRNPRHALCAALFTIFSGFYIAYWVSPDNFSPFALTASLSLLSMGKALKGNLRSSFKWFAISGVLIGLSHLSRSDGFLLLFVLPLALPFQSGRRKKLICYLLLLACYLLTMSPWFYRNLRVVGSPLPVGGIKTLFLRDYDDFFSYGKELTLRSYIAWGWKPILLSKLQAAWINLQTILAVDLMIFLPPFAAIGLWRLRRREGHLPFLVYSALLYLAMTLAFTFPGYRGGMLHSSCSLLPFLYASSMVGLDDVIGCVKRLRPNWEVEVARRFFSFGFVALAILLSALLYRRSLSWNERDVAYSEIADWLDDNAPPDAIVMVNNPPSFHYHSRRPCVVVPNEELSVVIEVCRRYGVDYLILDKNRPLPLALPYEIGDERLTLLATFEDETGRPIKLYRCVRGSV
jgi:hypothetical protein